MLIPTLRVKTPKTKAPKAEPLSEPTPTPEQVVACVQAEIDAFNAQMAALSAELAAIEAEIPAVIRLQPQKAGELARRKAEIVNMQQAQPVVMAELNGKLRLAKLALLESRYAVAFKEYLHWQREESILQEKVEATRKAALVAQQDLNAHTQHNAASGTMAGIEFEHRRLSGVESLTLDVLHRIEAAEVAKFKSQQKDN